MSPTARSRARDSTGSLSRTNSSSARVALRKGDLKISDPIPIPRAGDGYGPQSLPVNTGPTQRQSNPIHSDTYDHARSNPRIPSYATVPTFTNDSSKSSLSKPKEGGFKATIKRLFGSKKKRDTVEGILVEEQKKREALSFITTADSAKEQSQPRQRGLSVPAITRYSALGSHAPSTTYIVPEDGVPTEAKGRSSNESGVETHRRCNTLPSMILTQKDEEPIKSSMDDSAIRPSSRSKSIKNDAKRRSRSAENLMNRLKPIEWPRNRTDEIQYWRKSVVDSPVPSFKPQTTNEHDEVPVAEEDQHSDKKSVPIEPVQTFDFGLDNPTGQNNDSTEQRLTTLEIKLVDLEFAIAKLQQNSGSEKTMVLERPPLPRTQRSQVSVGTTSSASGIASPEPTFLSSPRASSAFSKDSDEQTSSPPLEHRLHRTSAATTLRPSTAVRRSVEHEAPAPQLPYVTMEQVQNLLAMIQREQASRHRLELQVKTLSSQLEQFQRSPPYAHFKANLYPTPSPDEPTGVGRQPVRPGAMSSERRANPPPPFPSSKFRDNDSISTTDDEEGVDVYETPTEDREQRFNLEPFRNPQMVGMI